jgi:uncharacterized membrane protein YphA (DoxX/SURF4 family)
MNATIWICQVLLAGAFLYSGIMKVSQSKEKLMSIGQTGIAAFPLPAIRLIAILELLGVAGLIIPWRTDILPVLSPVSALCFAVIMLLAAPIHYRRREYKSVKLNIVLLAVCILAAILMFTTMDN